MGAPTLTPPPLQAADDACDVGNSVSNLVAMGGGGWLPAVGLPEGYRGAAGSLLDTFGVDPAALGSALVAELRAGVR